MRRQILVVGPPLAGVDGVIAALAERLPDCAVIGADGLDPRDAPDAVVAVVSAVAPLTASDWELIARAAARTDLLVGAVSKIDAHRTWRDVLATDRALAAAWDAHGRGIPWVGVAAAPRLGEPIVADLVAELKAGLAEPGLDDRNRLVRNRSRAVPRVRPSIAAVDSRVALQRVRLRLLRFVRDGGASIRTEWRDAAAAIPAGGASRFESRVRDDVARFVADLDGEITRAVDDAVVELALDDVGSARLRVPTTTAPPPVEAAPSASRHLETRLMAVLGVSVGLGMALASSRLLSGVAPGLTIVGWVMGAAVGSLVVGWVVRTRGILHDRALLDRWATDVAATLRWHGEAMVADRLLNVESARSATARASPTATQSGY